jgi:hypothetical protein
MVGKGQFEDTPVPSSPGNVFEPTSGSGAIDGGWRSDTSSSLARSAGVAAVVVGIGALVRRWWSNVR